MGDVFKVLDLTGVPRKSPAGAVMDVDVFVYGPNDVVDVYIVYYLPKRCFCWS